MNIQEYKRSLHSIRSLIHDPTVEGINYGFVNILIQSGGTERSCRSIIFDSRRLKVVASLINNTKIIILNPYSEFSEGLSYIRDWHVVETNNPADWYVDLAPKRIVKRALADYIVSTQMEALSDEGGTYTFSLENSDVIVKDEIVNCFYKIFTTNGRYLGDRTSLANILTSSANEFTLELSRTPENIDEESTNQDTYVYYI